MRMVELPTAGGEVEAGEEILGSGPICELGDDATVPRLVELLQNDPGSVVVPLWKERLDIRRSCIGRIR